jgi:O-glycosyl hydrolase
MTLIASPWSAPSWLKVMNSLLGLRDKNTLIDDDDIYDTYATYLLKTIKAFK